MKQIPIQKSTPRNIHSLEKYITLSKGTGGALLFIAILTGLALMLIFSFFLPPYDGGLIAFKITMLIVSIIFSVLLFRWRIRKIKARVNAFANGTPIEAKVTNHGRSMNPGRSKFNYTATISIPLENGKSVQQNIVSPDEDLWRALPMQQSVTVLYHAESNSLFVAELFGCKLSVE
ncbi:MAG: hypothetical protein V2A54_06080 [Bacteroidota bacterium]